jgi:hypothetical protein
MNMDSDQFYRAGVANSTLSESLYTDRYSQENAEKYLGKLGDAAFGGAQNKDSISAFATSAAALFGRDTASFEEALGAMGQGDDAWNSYLKGLGLSKADADKLNSMRATWNAKGMNKDAARFVVHGMQREANLDNAGIVAKSQQDQAFMSSFLAKQKVNLDIFDRNDSSVLLGVFGEGGAVSDEAALVYGKTGAHARGFVVGEDGNVANMAQMLRQKVGDKTVAQLLGVKDLADAEKQGLTTGAGLTRKLADLQSQGYVVSQSESGSIYVGTKEEAQKAREDMNAAIDSTPGMKTVRGMFAGDKISDFNYDAKTGQYSFKINGEEEARTGDSAMKYLHHKMSKDPALRKELEFKADAANGFDEATVAQAQKTLTAMRALDAAKSFDFNFNRFEEHWYGNTDERGIQDRLFWDKKGDATGFKSLVDNYLQNPSSDPDMAKRLDFMDAIKGRSKEELTALGYLDEHENWTEMAAKKSGVKDLEGKSTKDDKHLEKLMKAGREDGPAESILQILSRLVVGDKLKVTDK